MAEFTNYKTNPYSPVLRTRIKSAASTNAQAVFAGPCNLIAMTVANNTAAMKFVKVYNASGTPVPGTSTQVLSIACPPNQTWTHNWDAGLNIPIALGIAITGGAADSDATATAVDDVHLTLCYAQN